MKGGLLINPKYTSENAFTFFIKNSTVSYFTKGSNGFILTCTLNDGIESPYKNIRIGTTQNPVRRLIVKITIINLNDEENIDYYLTNDLFNDNDRIDSSSEEDFLKEVGIQTKIFSKTLKYSDPICPSIIYSKSFIANKDNAEILQLFIDNFDVKQPEKKKILTILLDNFKGENNYEDDDDDGGSGDDDESDDDKVFFNFGMIGMEIPDNYYDFNSIVDKNNNLSQEEKYMFECMARYRYIELALKTGYAQNDFHFKNFLVNIDTRNILIIDFGLSKKIPDNLMEKIKKHYDKNEFIDILYIFYEDDYFSTHFKFKDYEQYGWLVEDEIKEENEINETIKQIKERSEEEEVKRGVLSYDKKQIYQGEALALPHTEDDSDEDEDSEEDASDTEEEEDEEEDSDEDEEDSDEDEEDSDEDEGSEEDEESKESKDKPDKFFNLEDEYKRIHNIENDKERNKELRNFNMEKEKRNMNSFLNDKNEYDYLYPHLDDPNFNIKIANKKEFNDTKYDGSIVDDVENHANMLCNAEFEMSPHQSFVRNFLSFQTPYNSLLLYHGLGSGKTCSAINVAEEMREYLKQMNISQRIIFVASPNVQENFKVQLFDDRKLKLVDGIWNIRACTGNNLLKEINPMNMKGLTKERVKSQINRIINASYMFLGYIQFANFVNKMITVSYEMNETKKRNFIKMRIKNAFNNSLLIIDEVHNIRNSDEKNKLVANALTTVVENSTNLRLLLLSATPMFNNYKEIIWLVNLMNKNDKRPAISVKDVFDSNGSFKVDKDGKEVGKELLIRKSTGYISFVRGENPYTFPYRIWASEIDENSTFLYSNERNELGIDMGADASGRVTPPIFQMNGDTIPIQDRLKMLSIYLVDIGEYQQKVYNYIVKAYLKQQNEKKERDKLKMQTVDAAVDIDEVDVDEVVQETNEVNAYEVEADANVDNMEEVDEKDIEDEVREPKNKKKTEVIEESDDIAAIKYTDLQQPLESLNIVYPNDKFMEIYSKEHDDERKEDDDESQFDTKKLVGKKGLLNIVEYNVQNKKEFKYKKNAPHIFAPSELGKYSGKMKTICDKIMNSTGIALVYSQFIDGGIVPLSLALEELGFTRAGSRSSLFAKGEVKGEIQKDAEGKKRKLKYISITGDKLLSPDNGADIKLLTDLKNKDGDEIKVVLISQAGAEGIDFKYIRQVHVLDPWYNINRIEQIIGRAVRTCSHKDLPYEKRNVEIYLYGSILSNEKQKEAADIYMYRLAERKAIQIGKVSRILKETAVDCILNSGQIGFTVENMNKTVKQVLSSGKVIDNYQIGDRPYTSTCDYMDKCMYECKPNMVNENVTLDTYSKAFIMTNIDKIIQRIRTLFEDRFFYTKKELITHINAVKPYKLVQINSALNRIVEDKYEVFKDKYDRDGHIVNIDDLYLFQPIELNNEHISVYDRSVPIDYKREVINITLPKTISESEYRVPKIKRVIDYDYSKIEEKSDIGDMVNREKVQMSTNADIVSILKTIVANYNLATNENAQDKDKKSKNVKKDKQMETNWYYNCNTIFTYLNDDEILKKLNVGTSVLIQYIITRILFDLSFIDMIELMNHLYNEKREKYTPEIEDFLSRVKVVIDQLIIKNRNKKGIVLLETSKPQFKQNKKKVNEEVEFMDKMNDIGLALVMYSNGKWSKTNKISDYDEMKDIILSNMVTQRDIKKNGINETFGFLLYFINGNYLVFKTKNINDKRSKGSRCDQKAYNDNKTILYDAILDKVDSLKDYFNERKDKEIYENKKYICIMQEFLLYIFNENKVNGKKWLLNPIVSTLSNIENL